MSDISDQQIHELVDLRRELSERITMYMQRPLSVTITDALLFLALQELRDQGGGISQRLHLEQMRRHQKAKATQ